MLHTRLADFGIPDVGGMNVEGMDPKTALNQYCQRFCSRPVTKTDIVYTSTKFGVNQYQAIVTLNCMQGQEYAGELGPNPKEAEKSAAFQALQAYRGVDLPAQQPGVKKKKPSGPMIDPETGKLIENSDEEENPALTHKVLLNAACMKIARRALAKGETIYESVQVSSNGKVPSGYIATVQLTCLPGDWTEKIFQGEVSANKQSAAQSAAKVALTEIMADPELSVLVNKVPTKPSGKGKGKGLKGKWLFWGKGWPDGPDLPREPVTEGLVNGEVVDWKGTFGWIQPAVELEHPAACRRGGRVYVHQQDIAGGMQELEVGTKVRFQVYCDPSGLGAELVVLN